MIREIARNMYMHIYTIFHKYSFFILRKMFVKDGLRSFRWNGMVIIEPANSNYYPRKIIGDLSSFDDMSAIAVASASDSHPVVLDIGANIGMSALAFQHKAKVVYAFEPFPDNFNLLEKNVTSNGGKVQIFNFGMSDRPGDLMMSAGNGDHESASIVRSKDGISVKFYTIDAFCDEYNINNVDFIKIDTEGHDYNVFIGAKSVILRYRPVILTEVIIKSMKIHGNSISDYLNDIVDSGYDMYIPSRRSTYKKANIENLSSDPNLNTNLLLIPSSHRSWVRERISLLDQGG